MGGALQSSWQNINHPVLPRPKSGTVSPHVSADHHQSSASEAGFIIEVKFRRECCRVGKRGGIDMHGAVIMAGFKTKGRATCAAKITPYAWRTFKGGRSCAPPFEIRERHADPGNNRCRTIPATVVAIATTAPARLSLELPAVFRQRQCAAVVMMVCSRVFEQADTYAGQVRPGKKEFRQARKITEIQKTFRI